MTHFYAGYHSFEWDMIHSYIEHDSFEYERERGTERARDRAFAVTLLCLAHSYMEHDSFEYENLLQDRGRKRETLLNSYLRHESILILDMNYKSENTQWRK